MRPIALAAPLALTAGLLLAPIATAGTVATTTTEVQQAVERSVASAAAKGITQGIAVVDRETGARVAGSGGDRQYISESIVKLFTVAYYVAKAGGRPDESMTHTLRSMIVNSDDGIESSLWNVHIVPTVAARYGLEHTSNGPKTGPHDWGWELITADDEAKFLYEMSNDPDVAPLLMDAMANTSRTGSDGFDQHFGMNTLAGDHGSKQGWTDVGAGASQPAEIHSVGWTDRYFVAILETADRPDVDEMRAQSTAAAQAVLAAEGSGVVPGTTVPKTTVPKTTVPKTTVPKTTVPGPVATTSSSVPVPPAAPPLPTTNASGGSVAGPTDGAFTALLQALGHEIASMVRGLVALMNW